MADYIEREAVIEICSNQYKECLRKNDWCGDTVAWNIGFAVKDIPAADVVEVVRCKDCVHGTLYTNMAGAEYVDCGLDDHHVWLPNSFCSYGERRAD